MSGPRKPSRIDNLDLARLAQEVEGDGNPRTYAENLRKAFMAHLENTKVYVALLRRAAHFEATAPATTAYGMLSDTPDREGHGEIPEEVRRASQIVYLIEATLSDLARLRDDMEQLFDHALAEAEMARGARVAGGRKPKRLEEHAAWQQMARAIWQRKPRLTATAVARSIMNTLSPNADEQTVRKIIAKVRPPPAGAPEKHLVSN